MLSSSYSYEYLEKKESSKLAGLTKQDKKGDFTVLTRTSEQRALCTILVLCLVSQASIFLFCVVFTRIVQAELQSSVPCSLFSASPSRPCCPDDASQKQFSWFSDWIQKVQKRENLVHVDLVSWKKDEES